MSEILCVICGLSVVSFAGGEERGKCLQFNMPPAYTQLDRQDVEQLRDVLDEWLKGGKNHA